jgi:hypothetical protein
MIVPCVAQGKIAHYLPLISCLNYLLARKQRDAHGKVTQGLNAAQRGQVLLAMRLSQLRDLDAELNRVRDHEQAVGVQDSDRRLLAEGIKSTALSIAAAAAPVDTFSLDPGTAAMMRQIAAKIHVGQRKAHEWGIAYDALPAEERPTEEQRHFFNVRRPRAMMRLHGVERLKAELETLEGKVRALRVPDEDDMVHLPLVDPKQGEHKAGTWSNSATLVPYGGFELLRESRPEHRFKGENMQGSTQMFVDVTTPDAHVKDWAEASRAILDCADRAEKLLARSACCSHSLVYHQVLALVEHYFLCVLPVPSPAQVGAEMNTHREDDDDDDDGAGASGDAAGGAEAEGDADDTAEGPYTPRERANVSVQRDCLRALDGIGSWPNLRQASGNLPDADPVFCVGQTSCCFTWPPSRRCGRRTTPRLSICA